MYSRAPSPQDHQSRWSCGRCWKTWKVFHEVTNTTLQVPLYIQADSVRYFGQSSANLYNSYFINAGAAEPLSTLYPE